MPPVRSLYVTDTHPFVWYLVDDASPGSRARIAYDRADSGEATIIIPAIVLAESLYLAEKGRIKARSEQIFGTMDNALNYRIYPLDLTHPEGLGAEEVDRDSRQNDRGHSEASQLRTHH